MTINSSLWWRNLIDIVVSMGLKDSWFQNNISCKPGSGSKFYFWRFKWFGPKPLKDVFLVVLDLFCDHRLTVSSTCDWHLGNWSWNLGIDISLLFADSRIKLQGLQAILLNIFPDPLAPDSLTWWRDLSYPNFV